MGSLFSNKSQQNSVQNSTSTGTTQNNLWDNPNLQNFLSGYTNQYSNAGNFSAPVNSWQTGAAGNQANVANPGNLTTAFGAANGVAQDGISSGDISKFMSPYISNVVNPTIAAQNLQNQQALSNIDGSSAAKGALGNNTGQKAAYMAGVQPQQQAQIASLYNSGYGQATNTAAQNAGVKLQGAGTAGSLTGAASGANTALGNLGQNVWQSNYSNSMAPYSLYNQGVQGFQGFGSLAGMNTSGTTNGTTNSSGSTTPSPWAQGMSVLGTLFGMADGGSIPEYSGGGGTGYELPVIPSLPAVPNMIPQATAIPSFGGQKGGQGQQGEQGQDQGGGLVGSASRFLKPYLGGSSTTVPGSAATGGWSTTTTLPGMFGFADGGAANPHNPNGSVMDKMLHAAHALKEFKNGGAPALPRYDSGGGVDPDADREANRGRGLSSMPYMSSDVTVPAITESREIKPYGMAGDAYVPPSAGSTPMASPSYVGASPAPAPVAQPGIGQNIMDHGLVSGLLRSAGMAPTEQPQAHPLAPRRSDFDNRMKRWSNLFLSQGVNPQAAQSQLAVDAAVRDQAHNNAGNLIQQGQMTGVLNTPNGSVPTLASKQYDLAAAQSPAHIRQMNAAALAAETGADKQYLLDLEKKKMEYQRELDVAKNRAEFEQLFELRRRMKEEAQRAAGGTQPAANSRHDWVPEPEAQPAAPVQSPPPVAAAPAPPPPPSRDNRGRLIRGTPEQPYESKDQAGFGEYYRNVDGRVYRRGSVRLGDTPYNGAQ